MTTVVNNPGGASGESSGMGMVLGVILAIAIIALFFVYGLPAIRGNPSSQDGTTNVNVTLPNTGGSPSPSPAGGLY